MLKERERERKRLIIIIINLSAILLEQHTGYGTISSIIYLFYLLYYNFHKNEIHTVKVFFSIELKSKIRTKCMYF